MGRHDEKTTNDEAHRIGTETRSALRAKRAGDVPARVTGSAPSPLVAIENETPPRLMVDPPHPDLLARGRVSIGYRTENVRLLPVYGVGALDVSPRLGHLHVTVDDAPWHFVDASGEAIVVVGLAPGPHRIRFELADPTHRVVASETVTFDVP